MISLVAAALGIQKLFSLVHEIGHYTTAKALFHGPASIHFSLLNCHTIYQDHQMTLLGKKIGRRYSNGAISAAGPLFELFVASLGLISSVHLHQSHPILGNSLKWGSLLSFLNCESYALSTYFEPPTNFQHDFVMLKSFGISPLSSIIAIAALAIICTKH